MAPWQSIARPLTYPLPKAMVLDVVPIRKVKLQLTASTAGTSSSAGSIETAMPAGNAGDNGPDRSGAWARSGCEFMT